MFSPHFFHISKGQTGLVFSIVFRRERKRERMRKDRKEREKKREREKKELQCKIINKL